MKNCQKATKEKHSCPTFIIYMYQFFSITVLDQLVHDLNMKIQTQNEKKGGVHFTWITNAHTITYCPIVINVLLHTKSQNLNILYCARGWRWVVPFANPSGHQTTNPTSHRPCKQQSTQQNPQASYNNHPQPSLIYCTDKNQYNQTNWRGGPKEFTLKRQT